MSMHLTLLLSPWTSKGTINEKSEFTHQHCSNLNVVNPFNHKYQVRIQFPPHREHSLSPLHEPMMFGEILWESYKHIETWCGQNSR